LKAIGLPARSAGWLNEKKMSRILLLAGVILLVALVVGLLGYLFVEDVLAFGRFPGGVKIVGVNVAGLTQEEAITKLRTELQPVANKPLTLKVDEEKYQISPVELGLMLDYKKMVEEGYSKAWNVNIFERMARRFVNRPKSVYVSLVASGNPERVQGYLGTIVNSINRYPEDAYVDVTSGKPVIVKAKDGRNTPMDQLQKDTDAALTTSSRTVNVQVGRTPAALTDAAFGKMIIVNINEHKLSLYNRDKVLVEYPVACGSPEWPSPPGAWKVVQKEKNPSWSNPGSSWAVGMPASIGPGPGNPLGTRALATSATGVLIHGTPSSWSIGTNVSHGCIRMYMKDVEALFEMVDAGIPVYIIKASGTPGFDVKTKPH
jgi:lipoprotein-anchoring transpeptidase ErfK/SrfK